MAAGLVGRRNVVGSYNHEEFVPEVSTGGDGRGEGDASRGMRGSRLCVEVGCCELRVEEESLQL